MVYTDATGGAPGCCPALMDLGESGLPPTVTRSWYRDRVTPNIRTGKCLWPLLRASSRRSGVLAWSANAWLWEARAGKCSLYLVRDRTLCLQINLKVVECIQGNIMNTTEIHSCKFS
jgi:hypothetical protein